MSQADDHATIQTMTTDLAAAYLSNHRLPPADISGLISSVHSAIASLMGDAHTAPAEDYPSKPTPTQIRKSIAPDGLVSFLDDRTYKTLRRRPGAYGSDPNSYRVKFGLLSDYPMTSPSYSARRSELAKGMGLGRRPATQVREEASPPMPIDHPFMSHRKLGRRRLGSLLSPVVESRAASLYPAPPMGEKGSETEPVWPPR